MMTLSHAPRLPLVVLMALLVLVVQTAAAQQQPSSLLTPQHELLNNDVGTWETTITIWPEPDAEPIVSHGRETSELLPGGLWLVTQFEGEMAGMPCTGAGAWGYDPVEKKYVGAWVDSMTPYLTTMKGDYDPQTKTMTLMTDGRDPATGKKVQYKVTTQYLDDGTKLAQMYATGADGQAWKMSEVRYRRAAEQ
jgi:hypothetical protein